MTAFANRLAAGDVIVIDGATGTELELRGVPMLEGAWCGITSLRYGDDVKAVHRSHIAAGAELIIANTYASSRHLLDQVGQADLFESVNRAAVRTAVEARDEAVAEGAQPVVVAASLATTQMAGSHPPVAVARRNFADQARIQADAGAEMFVLEMLRDVEQSEAALQGALTTGLPVWMGFSCVMQDGEPYLYDRIDRLEDAVLAFVDAPVELLAIMHSETDDIDACLDVVQRHWSGPVGVYAQNGKFSDPHWVFTDTLSPESYSDACLRWVDRGVQAIGGCCGIGPDHIAHLGARLAERS